MIELIGIYFIYNFLLRLGLVFYYFKKESFTSYGHEPLLLLFCPAVGLGYWSYYSDLRTNGQTDLPQSWYIWRKMIRVHTGFIILLCFIAFSMLAGCGAVVGKGMNWASHENNASAVGLGLLFDAASLAVVGVLLMAALCGILFAAAILILIPYLIANSIERTQYAILYAEQKRQQMAAAQQSHITINTDDTTHT